MPDGHRFTPVQEQQAESVCSALHWACTHPPTRPPTLVRPVAQRALQLGGLAGEARRGGSGLGSSAGLLWLLLLRAIILWGRNIIIVREQGRRLVVGEGPVILVIPWTQRLVLHRRQRQRRPAAAAAVAAAAVGTGPQS